MSSCFYWNSASFYITQWSQHMVAVWWFVLCIANSWYLCTACLIGWQEMEKEEGSAGIACRNVTLFLTTRAEHMSNMFLLSVHWPTCRVKLRTCTIARGCSREVASTLLLSLCAMSLLFPLLTFQLTDISALFSEAILKNYHGISLCSVNTEESAKWCRDCLMQGCCPYKQIALYICDAFHYCPEEKVHAPGILLGHSFHVVFSLALNESFSYSVKSCITLGEPNSEHFLFNDQHIAQRHVEQMANSQLCTWPIVRPFFQHSDSESTVHVEHSRHVLAHTRCWHCSLAGLACHEGLFTHSIVQINKSGHLQWT